MRQKTRTTHRRIMRMRQLRRQKELTQSELARLVGLETSSISEYERGQKRPSVDKALNLARVLGTTVEDLLTYVEIESVA